MEYPPLVAGQTGRFAVHLTDLKAFKPLLEGKVTVRLEQAGASPQEFSAAAPSRPGIFGIEVAPAKAGRFSMTVLLESAKLRDTHALGAVTVYGRAQEVEAPAGEEGAAIPYLKEQQWTLDFATEVVAQRPLRAAIRVPAEVRPRTGGEAQISAPLAGQVSSRSPIPAIGAAVARDQTLALLIPATPNPADRPSLESAHAEAQAAWNLARNDRERAERLLAAGAVPAKRLDEAKAAETSAQARLASAEARITQHEASRSSQAGGSDSSAFVLRSPINGVLAEVSAVAGSRVESGQALFRVVATDTVFVVGNVPESEASRLRQLAGAELEIPGSDQPVRAGRMVSVVGVVDPASRTLPVVYEVPNGKRQVAVGQAVFLRLFTGARETAPAVPESAIVDDAGRPVIFVQSAGESFERRPVRIGNRENGYAHILEGVKAGERVVTRGAYQIRLAALSPQIPAHGHVH